MKNDDIISVNKPLGISPLDAIYLLRNKRPELQNQPITYAGRLDPMAEGVLLLLTNEAIKNKEVIQKLDKKYDGTFVLGLETDTYDILGIPQNKLEIINGKLEIVDIIKISEKYIGQVSLPFPPFSSYKVKGKPLFQWVLDGEIDKIEIPIQKTNIYDIEIKKLGVILGYNLKKYIFDRISKVKGNFRQIEINERWNKFFEVKLKQKFQTIEFSIHCSSGTYVRSIVNDIGKTLKIGAVLTKLVRTSVGEYKLIDSLNLE